MQMKLRHVQIFLLRAQALIHVGLSGLLGALRRQDTPSSCKHGIFDRGHNFILMMNMATRAHHTIAIISPTFLEASYVQPEWASALRSDPTGMGRKLIPVCVQECEADALLAPIVRIDLFGCDSEIAR
jgi:hypothetical protein